MCSVQSKERILSILREFDVFVPDHLQSSAHSGRNGGGEAEVEIIFEEAIASEPKTTGDTLQIAQEESSFSTSSHTCVRNSKELILWESNISRSIQDSRQNEEKLHEKLSNSHKMYSNKSKTLCGLKTTILNSNTNITETVDESEISRPFEDPLFNVVNNQPTLLEKTPYSLVSSETVAVVTKDIPSSSNFSVHESKAEDEWTIQQIPDRQTVTLQFPAHIPGSTTTHPKELEHNLIKRTATPHNTSTYPLPLYHSHTWCYGIYTPVDPATVSYEQAQHDHPLSTNKGKPFVHDWTSFKQPTFLVSRPQRVYSRREVFRERSNQSKAVLKLTDIQNMKAHKGKIHVTLNGKPIVQPALPQLFHGGGDYENGEPTDASNQQHACTIRRSTSVANVPESEDDKIDFALAKHFLQEEVRFKQKLQMRLKMFSDRLTQ